MIDERDLREMLDRRVRSISAMPTETPKAVRRARRRLLRNGAVAAAAGVLAIVGAFTGVQTIRTASTPADHSKPSPGVERRAGETLEYTGEQLNGPDIGDIRAIDPTTGQTRILVSANEVGGQLDAAAWSADGSWLGFSIIGCTPDVRTAGVWITDASGQPRRVVAAPTCDDEPDGYHASVWAWSPVTSQIVAQRASSDGTSLVLIDAATGNEIDLGRVGDQVSELIWSPDGTRVLYALGHSIRSVTIEDSVHSVLADSLGYVEPIYHAPGPYPTGMSWSPDGAHLLFVTTDGFFAMKPDGSDLRKLVDLIHPELSGFAWSPDGSAVAFGSYWQQGKDRRFRISTVSLQDPAPIIVYEVAVAHGTNDSTAPVWSPDGTEIAYRIGYNDTWNNPDAPRYVVVDAKGSGEARPLDPAVYKSWRGGWYHCECYG